MYVILDKPFYEIDAISASLIYFVDLHLDLFVWYLWLDAIRYALITST